jgi:hypothetical protein
MFLKADETAVVTGIAVLLWVKHVSDFNGQLTKVKLCKVMFQERESPTNLRRNSQSS